MTTKTQKAIENKENTNRAVVDAAQAADAAAATFTDCLLSSTAYIAMAEKMPAIATKLEGVDKTVKVKTGEITNLVYDFVVSWHDLSTGGYALERNMARDFAYAAANRTGTKSEVKGKIKLAAGTFASQTTQATRDAMLAFKNVNECTLDSDGHLVAPNNIMRPLITETVSEDDGEGNMVDVKYKDQPNMDSSLGSVPEAKARIWAAAAGIVTKTGSKAGTAKTQTLAELEEAINLLSAGDAADHNLAEQEIIRRIAKTMQTMVDTLDCQNIDGNLDTALFEAVQSTREDALKDAYNVAN